MLRPATPADLPLLREVERAAGEAFRDLGMADVADDEPLGTTELEVFQEDGRAWVAADAGDRPVAYLLLAVVDGAAHVEQVSVHPVHARLGLGRSLIDLAEGWAAARGMTQLTLTTYAEVPWNAPYYARLGFVELDGAALGPGLSRLRDDEAARGLARWPRVVLARPVTAGRGAATPSSAGRSRSRSSARP